MLFGSVEVTNLNFQLQPLKITQILFQVVTSKWLQSIPFVLLNLIIITFIGLLDVFVLYDIVHELVLFVVILLFVDVLEVQVHVSLNSLHLGPVSMACIRRLLFFKRLDHNSLITLYNFSFQVFRLLFVLNYG